MSISNQLFALKSEETSERRVCLWQRASPSKLADFSHVHCELSPAHTRVISWAERHSRDCWRKLFLQVCGVIFCDFRHACHRHRIFNMLNNFMHEWTFPHSVRALWAISAVIIDANTHDFIIWLWLLACVFITYLTQDSDFKVVRTRTRTSIIKCLINIRISTLKCFNMPLVLGGVKPMILPTSFD